MAFVDKPGRKAGVGWAPNVGYREMHKRLDRLNGIASSHRCVDCGEPAEHWSYTHDDPGQLLGSNGCAYSLLSDKYEPRCVPCHSRFDRTADTDGVEQLEPTVAPAT